jgi:hypothetical protein
MRRLIALVAASFALIVVAAALGAPSTGDVNGRPCADVTFGDVGYFIDSTTGTGTFSATLTLAAPVCTNIDYTFYLLISGSKPLRVKGVPGDPGTVGFSYTFAAPAPNPICVYATTSSEGHVFDFAPDGGTAGCQTLDGSSGSGGGGGFN